MADIAGNAANLAGQSRQYVNICMYECVCVCAWFRAGTSVKNIPSTKTIEKTWQPWRKSNAAPQTIQWQAANCFSRWPLHEHTLFYAQNCGRTDIRPATRYVTRHTRRTTKQQRDGRTTWVRLGCCTLLKDGAHHPTINKNKKQETPNNTWTANKHGRMYCARWTPPVRSLASP